MSECKECRKAECGCSSKGTAVQPPLSSNTPSCPTPEPCPEVISTDCIVYTGDSKTCGDDPVYAEGDTIAEIQSQIVDYFCEEISQISGQIWTPTSNDSSVTIAQNGNTYDFSVPQATVPVANTIFVDKLKGDDGTGTFEDALKPFATITAARDYFVFTLLDTYSDLSSFPGVGDADRVYRALDTGYLYRFVQGFYYDKIDSVVIYIRPSKYTEFIEMNVDLLDYYCELGVTVRNIRSLVNNSVFDTTLVRSNCTGYANVEIDSFPSFTGAGIFCGGGNKYIYIQCLDIESANQGVAVNNRTVLESSLTVKCKSVKNVFQYLWDFRGIGPSKIDIEVTEDVWSPIAGITHFDFPGIANVKFRNHIVPSLAELTAYQVGKYGVAPSYTPSFLLGAAFSAQPQFNGTGTINLKGNIINNWDGGITSSTASLGIFHNRVTFEGEIISKGVVKPINFSDWFTPSSLFSLTLKNSKVVSDQTVVMDNYSTANFKAENTIFIRKDGGTDDNAVIKTYNVNTKKVMEFRNCQVIKNSSTGLTDSLVYVEGLSNAISFKDTDIICVGAPLAPACSAFDITSGEIYFKNTHSTQDNTVDITDMAVVSGFIGNDVNLTTSEKLTI
jgi:hypothetical protein